jgi:beta-lactamase regulating signal transducer with metallopeptidase domain
LLLWLGGHLFLHNLWIFLIVFMTKGLMLFGLAYAATKVFPTLPAERKHTIWFLIALAFMLLPAGRLLVPLVPFNLHDSNPSHSVIHLVTLPIAYSERVTSIIDSSGVNLGTIVKAPQGLLLLLPASLWLAGVAFFLLRYVSGRVALGRLAASPAVTQPLQDLLRDLASRMRVHREVSVVSSARCAIPLTYGWLNPRIVLPASSRAWVDERLRAVLVHELSHIKRADCLSNAVVYLVCCFLWFNPFAWLARAFMLKEAEMSCDRSVLTTGMRGTEYASTIVDLALAAHGNFLLPGAYGIVGKGSLLKDRVLRVLNWGGQPTPPVRTGKALLFCLSLFLLLFATTYSPRAGEKLTPPTVRLFGAVIAGKPQDVQAALDRGADVNERDKSGMTALIWAASSDGNPAVISVLLKAGANTEARDPENGGTALLWAAWNNRNPAVIDTLLKAGADIEARNKHGWTALMWAAFSNVNPGVITTLLKAGADAKAKNSWGKTAFDYAQGRGAILEGTDAYRQLEKASR